MQVSDGKDNKAYFRKHLQVPGEWSGGRLDSFLAQSASLGSLRFVRSNWPELQVMVNGCQAVKGRRLKVGDQVSYLLSCAEPAQPVCSAAIQARISLVQENQSFKALFKPRGLHTQSQGTRGGPSLEDCLPELFPDCRPFMLNRLDRDTSGLVLLAADQRSRDRYLLFQDQGLVCKYYLALVRGRLKQELQLQQALDTARRNKVRVLKGQQGHPLRQTRVQPLAFLPARDLSLVRVKICKGARHQIRAHLAQAGHPVYGDSKYADYAAQSSLYLHHYRISLPGFCAVYLPGWSLSG